MNPKSLYLAIVAVSAITGGCALAPSAEDIVPTSVVQDSGRPGPVAVAGWSTRGDVISTAEGGPYLLDTGDKLRVFVYGQPSISRLYTVDQKGKISMPLIGGVRARGLTTYGLERVLRDKLGASYVRDPQVTVDVQQNRPFFIHGEVRNAGQFPFVNGMTAETAVAIAGGYSERADQRRIKVTRKVDGDSLVMDVAPTDVLRPGDVIYVYERFI